MSDIKHISSPHNPLVKEISGLKDKSRQRRKSGLFILEGQREIALALKGGYRLRTVVYCPAVAPNLVLPASLEQVEVSQDVYAKLAHRGSTEGLLAVAHAKDHSLQTLAPGRKDPLFLIAEAPEKPGNIGALLRTADAAKLDGVIIANPRTDLYNPNIIRSSVGCLFTTKVATASTEEVLQFLQQHKLRLWCAALSASQPYHSVDFRPGGAIAVGTEAEGLQQQWLKASNQNIIIPMQGEIDSMNVSVSAAILIFEAMRQRGFQTS